MHHGSKIDRDDEDGANSDDEKRSFVSAANTVYNNMPVKRFGSGSQDKMPPSFEIPRFMALHDVYYDITEDLSTRFNTMVSSSKDGGATNISMTSFGDTTMRHLSSRKPTVSN